MIGGRRSDGQGRPARRVWWRLLRWTRDGALTVGAVAGAVCFVGMVICTAFNIRPIVFLSGSMSPAIEAGSLAFAQQTDVADLKPGDIVSVITDKGSRITHRLVAIDRSGVAPALRLKGDANPVEDLKPYIVKSADRVIFVVPYLGHGVAFISSPWGLFTLGVGVTGLLAYAFRPGMRRRGTRALLIGVVPLAATLALSNNATSTYALFTDTGTVTSAAASHQVQSQAQPTCQNVDGILVLGNIARITWTQVDARYEYAWELRNTSNSVVASGTIGTGVSQGSTITLDIGTGLIGVNANYNVVIRARLVNAQTWVAATTTTTPVRRASILIIGAAMRCGHS